MRRQRLLACGGLIKRRARGPSGPRTRVRVENGRAHRRVAPRAWAAASGPMDSAPHGRSGHASPHLARCPRLMGSVVALGTCPMVQSREAAVTPCCPLEPLVLARRPHHVLVRTPGFVSTRSVWRPARRARTRR